MNTTPGFLPRTSKPWLTLRHEFAQLQTAETAAGPSPALAASQPYTLGLLALERDLPGWVTALCVPQGTAADASPADLDRVKRAVTELSAALQQLCEGHPGQDRENESQAA